MKKAAIILSIVFATTGAVAAGVYAISPPSPDRVCQHIGDVGTLRAAELGEQYASAFAVIRPVEEEKCRARLGAIKRERPMDYPRVANCLQALTDLRNTTCFEPY